MGSYTSLGLLRHLQSVKAFKKSLPTPESLTFAVEGLKGKVEAPVHCWCCACVFHKASCVARVNTVTVHFTNALQKRALIFRTRTQDFWSRKEALFGWSQEIPLASFSTSHPMATSLGCKSEIFMRFTFVFLVFLSLNLSVRPLSTQLHHTGGCN